MREQGWKSDERALSKLTPNRLLTIARAIMVSVFVAGCSQTGGAASAPGRATTDPPATSIIAVPADLIGQASVIDGDTLDVSGRRIRLWGVDAPERAQSCLDPKGALQQAGQRSAEALNALVRDRTVFCLERDRDRWNRAVSVCYTAESDSASGPDAIDLSKAMVAQGWAFAYSRYSRDYEADEHAARASSAGLFAWLCQTPWDFRASRRISNADSPGSAGPP